MAKFCLKCQTVESDSKKKCPKCGRTLSAEVGESNIIFSIIFAIVGGVAAFAFSGSSSATAGVVGVMIGSSIGNNIVAKKQKAILAAEKVRKEREQAENKNSESVKNIESIGSTENFESPKEKAKEQSAEDLFKSWEA